MTTTTHDGASGAEARARIEAVLAEYPHVGPEGLDELLTWFRKEASSLDVALIASNPAIAEPYARFRADHIDPLRGKDVVRGVLVAALVVAIVAAIVWRAM